MQMIKYCLMFCFAICLVSANLTAQLVGQETVFDRELRNRDDQALREFVSSKENIDVKKKANNLEISGDVRFEWRNIQEKSVVLYDPYSDYYYNVSDGIGSSDSYSSSLPFSEQFRSLRGGSYVDSRNIPLSNNDFDVEFNLKIKYTFEKAWAMAHLQFDNPAGIRGRNDCFGTFAIFNKHGDLVATTTARNSRSAVKGSGESIFINLKRAYMGYNIWADGKHRLDIEAGRRKLDDVFLSEVQFSSRFDGVLLKYASAIDEIADLYCNTGVFIIDERVNHFGYVTELGLLNIFDTGLDLRYSFIDWSKQGKNRCFVRNALGTDFQNSQIAFSYTIKPTICEYELPVEFYGGFLFNHAARKTIFTHNKRKNLAWYAGIYIGNVNKKGDWAIDVEYVAVQAQAVHEYDVGSIARGNIADGVLTDILNVSMPNFDSSYIDSSDIPSYNSSGYHTVYLPRRGNANFIGMRCEFLYAVTDNLSIDLIGEFSNAEDKHIGGPHHYADFEIELIYAF